MANPDVPSLVMDAVELLKKDQDVLSRAFDAIGSHDSCSCPLACGYMICARLEWLPLGLGVKEKLSRMGWNATIYNRFICWYDARDISLFEGRGEVMTEREGILKRLLAPSSC